jgi:hypothetical protein
MDIGVTLPNGRYGESPLSSDFNDIGVLIFILHGAPILSICVDDPVGLLQSAGGSAVRRLDCDALTITRLLPFMRATRRENRNILDFSA